MINSGSVPTANPLLNAIVESPVIINIEQLSHDKVRIKYNNDNIYEGYQKDNQPDGKGKMVVMATQFPFECEGEWKSGIILYGIANYINSGHKYEGQFKNNEPSNGVIKYTSGAEYSGMIKNGWPHGYGTKKYADDATITIYSGNWLNGQPHGCGVMEEYSRKGNIAKTRHEGDFVNGKADGQGKMTVFNDGEYTGGHANGVRYGDGVFLYDNGNKLEGKWKNDIDVAKFTFTRPETGETMKGELYRGDKPFNSDIGVFYYKNGDRFEGKFVNGLETGTGTVTINGKKCEVKYDNGQVSIDHEVHFALKAGRATGVS